MRLTCQLSAAKIGNLRHCCGFLCQNALRVINVKLLWKSTSFGFLIFSNGFSLYVNLLDYITSKSIRQISNRRYRFGNEKVSNFPDGDATMCIF